jgi:glycopeptide antibiotics resistance protein
MMPRNAGKIAIMLVLWLAAVAVVVTGELLPAASAPMLWLGTLQISDKVMHFGAYLLLAFIPCFGFPLRTGISLSALLIALGVALEFAQKLVPGRSCDPLDALANTLGVVLGGVLGVLAGRLRVFRRG